MLKRLLVLLTALILGGTTSAQVNLKDTTIGMAMFYATYSYQFSGGGLAKLYGGNSSIGGGFQYKLRSNWVIGAEGNFLFGGTVKNSDSLIKMIANDEGLVIDENGYMAGINYYERGWSVYGKFGKIFPMYPTLAPNRNCGLTVMLGGGYIQNHINIHNPDGTTPQINDDYGKGYDRLNSGIAVTASVGYLFMSNSRLLNFYAGFEFIQAWTKSLRQYDFDRMAYDNTKYSSQFYGLKVCWFVPIYARKPKDFYYY
ncbi:MAG: hypothetical protein NTW31_13390 [Bacteroidetes bacterium]|nr:hypothetical protein [Bacteroidota bacterium]